MPNRLIARAAVAVLFVVALVTTGPGAADAAPSTLRVTAVEDVMGLTSRLVFSTSMGQGTGARAATLTNTGSSTIRVTDLTIGGLHGNQFRLALGQNWARGKAEEAAEERN